jgi:hypothetical protein
MATEINLHEVIADLSQQTAKLTQENAVLRAVIRAQNNQPLAQELDK